MLLEPSKRVSVLIMFVIISTIILLVLVPNPGFIWRCCRLHSPLPDNVGPRSGVRAAKINNSLQIKSVENVLSLHRTTNEWYLLNGKE